MARSLSILVSARGEDWSYVPDVAQRHGLGVEISDFADPDLLEGDWQARLQELRPLLARIPGERALHGPRSDMNPGLRDRGLRAFIQRRYRLAFEVATAAEAQSIIYHSGFNPMIRAPGFDRRWIRRSAELWRELATEAGALGLQILLENVWEPEPWILRDLVDAVDSPHLRACFDMGHANVYAHHPAREWLDQLGERIATVHLHSNDGRRDSHLPLGQGTVDLQSLLPLLTLSSTPPRLVLEVSGGRQEVEDSLFYLRRLLSLG